MAIQTIDTTTDHGTYRGDPAKTAFEKINANFSEIAGAGGSGLNLKAFAALSGVAGSFPAFSGPGAMRVAAIVGSVSSDTSGFPTGAIIESGSNANGNYTKFADGRLICVSVRVGINVVTNPGGFIIPPDTLAAAFINDFERACYCNLTLFEGVDGGGREIYALRSSYGKTGIFTSTGRSPSAEGPSLSWTLGTIVSKSWICTKIDVGRWR